MSKREALYLTLAALGLLGTWYFNLQLFSPGSTFGLIDFYRLGFANPASSSITVDITVAFVAFSFWVVPEAARLGMRRAWLYPLLGFLVAFAFAYPLFLFLRERRLRRTGGSAREGARHG